MSDWTTTALTDVLDFREGPGIMAADFQNSGVPLVRLAGLKSGVPLLTGCNYLSLDKVLLKWSHFRVQTGDVLLSTSASLGEVAVVDEASQGAVPYTGIVGFRSRSPLLHQRFVRHLLTSPSFMSQIEAMGVGSVMKHFGPMHLRQMSVSFPSVRQQHAIAAVLGALDDKIAANLGLASTAGELAISHAATAPSTCLLGAIAQLDRTTVSPSRLAAEKIPHYSLPAFDIDATPALEWPGDIKSAKFWMETPRVLVSKLNPRIPRIWAVDQITGLPGLASTEFMPIVPEAVSYKVVWAAVSAPEFGRRLEAQVAGTSGSHQRVRPDDLMATEVADPRLLPAKTTNLIDSLVSLRIQARSENGILRELRDTLLPALMSGRLRVKDAERQVEEAI